MPEVFVVVWQFWSKSWLRCKIILWEQRNKQTRLLKVFAIE
jgi:hypothetical protein